VTEEWKSIAVENPPTPRDVAAVAANRDEVVVWGGRDASSDQRYLNTGARYIPSSNTWASISTNGAPEARVSPSAVWAGTKVIVWGGRVQGGEGISTGGIYDPRTDRWSTIANTSGLEGRTDHSAVWTGTEMIVWGGQNPNQSATYYTNGARYNPASNSWSAITPVGCPSPRYLHFAAWTGTDMIIWGGYSGDAARTGAKYNPATDTWSSINNLGAPPYYHVNTLVWTGTEILAWTVQQMMTRFTPASNTWNTINVSPLGPAGPALWAGTRLCVLGGSDRTPSLSILEMSTSKWSFVDGPGGVRFPKT
jgi:hypothetical protein